MCTRGHYGRGTPHLWVGTVAQSICHRVRKASQAQQALQYERVEISARKRLVFMPPEQHSSAIRVGGALQKPSGFPTDLSRTLQEARALRAAAAAAGAFATESPRTTPAH